MTLPLYITLTDNMYGWDDETETIVAAYRSKTDALNHYDPYDIFTIHEFQVPSSVTKVYVITCEVDGGCYSPFTNKHTGRAYPGFKPQVFLTRDEAESVAEKTMDEENGVCNIMVFEVEIK